MARAVDRLTPRGIAALRKPGYYPDGGGLYLQVAARGSKSWVFRYTLNARGREMGLGSLTTYSLADARQVATDCRRQLHEKNDPIEARDATRAKGRLDAAKTLTFAQCSAAYIQAHRAGWRNAKHATQWENTIKTYAERLIGSLPVQSVDVDLVTRVLEPIWYDKPETASRLRGRLEAILDWATVRGHRVGENPARWRGHLETLLPARSKVKPVTNYPALPYAKLPDFMTKLRAEKGFAARALEFTILTAARTGEVIGCAPNEIDLSAKLWTVPGERTKARREHRVPLSPAAVKLIESLQAPAERKFVFPGRQAIKGLSNMAMSAVLERMGREDLTVHGFRSTFRDWAAEQTNFPREVCEGALAHVSGDKTEAAYLRSDLFEKRRLLMLRWARYCDGTATAKVIALETQAVA